MIDRLISFLMAVSLAFLVWLYAHGREQETLDNVPIGVQLTLAAGLGEHYELEVTGTSQVLVSFTGPPSRIHELRGLLQRGEIHVELTVAVPEDRQTDSRVLDTVRVEAADIHVPPGVTPVVLEGRNRIPVTLYRLIEKPLPVRLDHAPDEDIGPVTIDPPTVLVRGPQEILDRARAIVTQPCTLTPTAEANRDQETALQRRVSLVREMEGHAVRTRPAVVLVRFTVRPREKVYTLADLPVHFLCPANFSLRPQFGDERTGKITVRVRGPAADFPPAIIAFIDLTAGKFEPGLYADEPVRLQLPKDYQLAQDPPRSPAFQLSLRDSTKGPDIPRDP